jgi:hypothetical protein
VAPSDDDVVKHLVPELNQEQSAPLTALGFRLLGAPPLPRAFDPFYIYVKPRGQCCTDGSSKGIAGEEFPVSEAAGVLLICKTRQR